MDTDQASGVPLQAELLKCCSVLATPKQGHIRGTDTGEKGRVPACTEMRDKALGRSGCLEAARMPVVWSVCVGSLCRLCVCFSAKILRCQFKRTFTAICLFVC